MSKGIPHIWKNDLKGLYIILITEKVEFTPKSIKIRQNALHEATIQNEALAGVVQWIEW